MKNKINKEEYFNLGKSKPILELLGNTAVILTNSYLTRDETKLFLRSFVIEMRAAIKEGDILPEKEKQISQLEAIYEDICFEEQQEQFYNKAKMS